MNLEQLASAAGLPFGTKYNLSWRTGGGGIDCSGFVDAVARFVGATGISATDWTGSLFPKTQSVSSLQPGDLVFFGDPNQTDSHVGIYAGGDQILNASSGIGGVGTSSLAGLTAFYHGQVQYRSIPALTDYFAAGGGALGSSAQLVSAQSSSDASSSSSSSSSSSAGWITLIPGFTLPGGGSWPGIKISFAWFWRVGFFLLAGLLVVVGLLVYFHKQIEQTVGTVAKDAGAVTVAA